MNLSLLKEFLEDDVRASIFSVHIGKIPGPDGFLVDFFKLLYEHLKKGLIPHDQRVSIFRKNFWPT
jgi:hypothetical protein